MSGRSRRLSPRAAAAALALGLALGAAPRALSVPSAPAQAELRGTALESGTRRPLTGAVATLHSESDPGSHYLTSSDPAGRFVFQGLPAGAYSLEVSLAGYRTARKAALEVRPPFRSIIEVLLEAGPDPAPAAGPPPSPLAGEEREPGAGAAGSGAAARGPAEGSQGALTVTLWDREQRPVPEGLVALVPADGEGERRTGRTDASGRIEFAALPSLRYRLTASAPGYLTVRADRLALERGSAARVSVILTPYPLDFAGSLEDLIPPEEPLRPPRIEVEADESKRP